MTVDVVIPTVGRPGLRLLLSSLRAQRGAGLGRILVVDDRRDGAPLALPEGVEGRRSGGRGPAAARNAGWRASTARWVAFVDDDVETPEGWAAQLVADVERAGERVGAVQGRVRVPAPRGRPTDWERQVLGLEQARYATADIAYRRDVLELVGGFDERFPRAYREDADLALRVLRAGFAIERGRRVAIHPIGPAPWWASAARQRGNADDALMRRLHGRGWRREAGATGGRFPRHVAIVAAGLTAAGAALLGHRTLAAVAGSLWVAGEAEFLWARIRPGAGTAREIAAMLATSVAIPPLAVAHRVAGEVSARRVAPVPKAVLVDRDGTLIDDVPYNGDPDRVVPVPGARAALARLRAAGIRLAVVTNQSGVGRGLLSHRAVREVGERVEQLVGPIGPWLVCPHAPEDGCRCRKPRPGLVLAAAHALGVRPEECVVIGDVGADVEAARAAGARAILVPTQTTRRAEVAAAPVVAPTLAAAVDLVLDGRP